MKEIQASLIGMAFGAGLFAAIAYICDEPSQVRFLWAVSVGAFTGILAAPEASPESFRHPKAFQIVSGVGAGLSVGLLFEASLTYTLGLCLAGAVIGFFAKNFIEIIWVP